MLCWRMFLPLSMHSDTVLIQVISIELVSSGTLRLLILEPCSVLHYPAICGTLEWLPVISLNFTRRYYNGMN